MCVKSYPFLPTRPIIHGKATILTTWSFQSVHDSFYLNRSISSTYMLRKNFMSFFRPLPVLFLFILRQDTAWDWKHVSQRIFRELCKGGQCLTCSPRIKRPYPNFSDPEWCVVLNSSINTRQFGISRALNVLEFRPFRSDGRVYSTAFSYWSYFRTSATGNWPKTVKGGREVSHQRSGRRYDPGSHKKCPTCVSRMMFLPNKTNARGKRAMLSRPSEA